MFHAIALSLSQDISVLFIVVIVVILLLLFCYFTSLHVYSSLVNFYVTAFLSPVYSDTTQLNSTSSELSCELSRFGHLYDVQLS